MSKLSKVKKWAETNGYYVKILDYKNSYHLQITVSEDLFFYVSFKESSIFQSIRGKKGMAKGIYLAIKYQNHLGYDFPYPSQKAVIEKMDQEINSLLSVVKKENGKL